MRYVLAISILSLSACTDAGASEEEKYRMVERQDGTEAELCQQGRAVARAYLDARNEEKYKDWKLTADIQCQAAELKKEYPLY